MILPIKYSTLYTLLCFEFWMVLPNSVRTSLHFSWHHFAFSKLNLLSEIFSILPLNCTCLLLVLLWLLLGFVLCLITCWLNSDLWLGFGCWVSCWTFAFLSLALLFWLRSLHECLSQIKRDFFVFMTLGCSDKHTKFQKHL